MRLKDRRAIVTGAASGIGQATAALFVAEGARVLAVDRPGSGVADGERVIALEQDIAAEGAAARIVGAAVERLGGLDILANIAGVSGRHTVEEMPTEHWDRVNGVNLRAMFLLCQAAIPQLKHSRAGRIINVASVMAQGTDFGLAAYCASKAGVTGLTRTLALELGKFGITANWLEPGAILTGMTRANMEQPHIRAVWEKKSPLKRLGQPEDMARAILFLASDDAGFVTGHGLVADGGLTLRV
jgi:NAD(P)-dependent dehydrogenase (short-subunit alcohol dehydrogenase family)